MKFAKELKEPNDFWINKTEKENLIKTSSKRKQNKN